MRQKVKLAFFAYKSLCADVVCLFDGPIVVVVAQENDGNIIVKALHELNEVKTTDGRHCNIYNDQVIGFLSEVFHRLGAAFRNIDVIPVLGEHLTSDL